MFTYMCTHVYLYNNTHRSDCLVVYVWCVWCVVCGVMCGVYACACVYVCVCVCVCECILIYLDTLSVSINDVAVM